MEGTGGVTGECSAVAEADHVRFETGELAERAVGKAAVGV